LPKYGFDHILEKLGYKDEDLRAAIECYTQFIDVGTMVSPTVFTRCILCYLMSDMPQEAQVCDDGEAFADPVWRVHEEVRIALKASNDAYATTANQHQ
jgi:hypothetical protein